MKHRTEEEGGVFAVQCRRKDGSIRWGEKVHNLVTNEGQNHLLDVQLHGVSAISPWYLVPVESDTAPDAAMTYAVPLFTECTAYEEATRQEYVEAASAGQSVTNAANKVACTMNDTKTIYGSAILGGGSAATTKGDNAGGGVLLACAKFTIPHDVIATDTLEITYTLGATDDGV